MADYYNIIKKTLNNLGDASPALREKIFSSARNTIHKQLENTANLSPEIIETHKASLEAAIQRLDNEYINAAQAAAAEAAAAQAAEAAEAAEAAAAQKTAQASAQVPTQKAATSQQAPVNPNPNQAKPAAQQPTQQNAAGNDSLLSIPDIPESDARFASKSKGNLSRTIILGFGAILIAVIAYMALENQDKITAMFDSKPEPKQQVAAKVVEPEISPLAEKKPEKMEQRLGSDGEEIASTPIATSTDSQTTKTTAKKAIETAEAEDIKTAEAEIKQEADETAAATDDNAAVPIASSALFYEEGKAADAGERLTGDIKWKLSQESIADGLAEEPVINASVKIPGNGLVLIMNIKRNLDDALAASHIVELIFSVPDDFAGRQIADARSLVFKQTEEARGVALIGVPVKVSDGIFLIALSNVENAKAQNLQVLAKLDWIDIPLKYETARRALLSFRKGAEGKKIFDEALAAWAKL